MHLPFIGKCVLEIRTHHHHVFCNPPPFPSGDITIFECESLNFQETYHLGFPGSSAGKESACNAGDPGSIPGLGRSSEKGIGYPLQSSWASLMAQLVKNLPVMQETWVISLGWEDPLEKRTATHSSSLAWRIPWTAQSMRHKESDTAE